MWLSGRCRFDPTLLARFGIRFSFARAPHCSLSLADGPVNSQFGKACARHRQRIREAENPDEDDAGGDSDADVCLRQMGDDVYYFTVRGLAAGVPYPLTLP
jgi:hypothetical protein